MARLSDLMNVHLKEIEVVIAQSNLLLQKKNDGQSGELKSAGNIVETFFRNFFSQIAPDSIRVTSGYVVDPLTFKERQNLTQHDILLSHKIVPPLFSIIENQIDIVPVESLVGIIEVKRTLTKETLKDAQKQILESYNTVIKKFKTKSMDNNTLGVTFQPSTTSPMFGIVGLTTQLSFEDIKEIVDPNIIDFVWAFNHNESFIVGDYNGRCTGTVSRKDVDRPRLLKIDGQNEIVFSKTKGIIRLWLSRLASHWIKAEAINGYYIDIWD